MMMVIQQGRKSNENKPGSHYFKIHKKVQFVKVTLVALKWQKNGIFQKSYIMEQHIAKTKCQKEPVH